MWIDGRVFADVYDALGIVGHGEEYTKYDSF